MTLVNVNGTSIQTAITNAQVGDTLAIAAGGYAGFRCDKKLDFRGDGVVIDGPLNTTEFTPTASGGSVVGQFTMRGATGRHGANILMRASDFTLDGIVTEEGEAGYGIRHYQTDRVTISNWTARKVAFALQFNGRATGSILQDFTFIDIDRMIVDDTTAGNDTGGTGIDFFKTVGPTIVRRGKMANMRSTHSYDYVRDGGAIAAYGGAKNVTIEDVEIRDALNVFEDGKASTEPDNANFIFRGVKAYGRAGAMGADKATQCQGVLVRAMQGMVWEDFYFEDLDGFGNFLFDHSGNYAGGLGAISLKGAMKLKPGALAYNFNPNVPLSAVTLADTVTYVDASKMIARVAGKGDTNNLGTFRTWGAQAPTEVWAPVAASDPCADIAAERDEALAKFAVATTQRDAYKSQIDRSKVILAEENGLVSPARKTLRDIINRADEVLTNG